MNVAELWRYPVKSLRGERLDRLEVAADGVRGDRMLRVEDERGTITARRKRAMVGLAATLDGGGEPLIAGEPWASEAAGVAIRRACGEDARLVRAESGHDHDLAQILLLGDGSLAQLGYDRRRFRPNIVFAGAVGPVEQGWVGGRVRAGELVLSVDRPDERCVITTIDPDTIEVDPEVLRRVNDELGGVMGVYCTILEPGVVAVGDPVEPIG